MKGNAIYDLLDLKKSISHISIFIFSLIVTILIRVSGKFPEALPFTITAFVMLVVQLEVFIYIGGTLFSKLSFNKSPAEITRIVLSRFAIFLGSCLVVSMILFILLKYAELYLRGESVSSVLDNFFHRQFNGWFKSTLTGLTAGAMIFIVFLWQDSLKREQKLREENLIFQNETLRSQVNPHFLFNSLNTISSLVQTQPDVAERFINSLASIYRYILENGQKDKVPLKAELEFITDYYNLHKVRDEEKILLSIDVPAAGSFNILPVSLQILLENAIKHNIATRESQLRIRVYVENEFIVVRNNLQRKATQLNSTAIGLKNLSERVRLVSGKELVIEDADNYFTVKLPLLK